MAEGLFPSLRALDLPVVVREFASSLNRETDFGREARSIVLIRAALSDVPDLWIPDVVAECSGATVLTMEYSPGERVDLYAKAHPQAMPRVVDTLVKLMLHSIFEEGLFHADPHPGNVFVLPDGRVALLDFGNTGDLDEPMRESLTLLLEAVVKGDARAATEAYLEMAPASEKVDRVGLLVDIKAVLYEIRRTNLADVSIGNAFESLLRAGSRNGVHNPGEFVLLTRAFAILESMIGLLAPGYNHMESFREEISRLTVQHFSPERIKGKDDQAGARNGAPGHRRARRHAPHPATFRRRRSGPASGPGGRGTPLQPQSRAAHGCHRFRGAGDQRLHAVAHADGRLASHARRNNDHQRHCGHRHRPHSRVASRP